LTESRWGYVVALVVAAFTGHCAFATITRWGRSIPLILIALVVGAAVAAAVYTVLAPRAPR
jgi:hypothetical protein